MPKPLHRFATALSLRLGLGLASVIAVPLVLAEQQAAPTPAAPEPTAPRKAAAQQTAPKKAKPASTTPAPSAREADRDEDAPRGTDVLAPGLDKLLQGSGDVDSFWIDVTWPTSANQLTAVRVFGSGVGT